MWLLKEYARLTGDRELDVDFAEAYGVQLAMRRSRFLRDDKNGMAWTVFGSWLRGRAATHCPHWVADIFVACIDSGIFFNNDDYQYMMGLNPVRNAVTSTRSLLRSIFVRSLIPAGYARATNVRFRGCTHGIWISALAGFMDELERDVYLNTLCVGYHMLGCHADYDDAIPAFAGTR